MKGPGPRQILLSRIDTVVARKQVNVTSSEIKAMLEEELHCGSTQRESAEGVPELVIGLSWSSEGMRQHFPLPRFVGLRVKRRAISSQHSPRMSPRWQNSLSLFPDAIFLKMCVSSINMNLLLKAFQVGLRAIHGQEPSLGTGLRLRWNMGIEQRHPSKGRRGPFCISPTQILLPCVQEDSRGKET